LVLKEGKGKGKEKGKERERERDWLLFVLSPSDTVGELHCDLALVRQAGVRVWSVGH